MIHFTFCLLDCGSEICVCTQKIRKKHEHQLHALAHMQLCSFFFSPSTGFCFIKSVDTKFANREREKKSFTEILAQIPRLTFCRNFSWYCPALEDLKEKNVHEPQTYRLYGLREQDLSLKTNTSGVLNTQTKTHLILLLNREKNIK